MNEPFIANFKREADGAYIRRMVKLLALKIGFASHSIDSILLLLTELLTNVTKHAKAYAQVIARPLIRHERTEGIEVSVQDSGPGISDINKALSDGYSTAGSLGLGLGALKRLSDEYSIDTYPSSRFTESGSNITFKKYLKSRPYYHKQLEYDIEYASKFSTSKEWYIDGYSQKRDGTRYNGDGIYWKNTENSIFVVIMDGVGHGYSAHQVTQRTLTLLKGMENIPIDNIITSIHDEISGTVGGQIAILTIDKTRNSGKYLIVGNIRGFHISSSSIKSLLSKDGTVGRLLPTLKIEELNLHQNSTIILHTDGISRAWVSNLKTSRHSPYNYSIGSEILRKHRKTRDDSSYVIIRSR